MNHTPIVCLSPPFVLAPALATTATNYDRQRRTAATGPRPDFDVTPLSRGRSKRGMGRGAKFAALCLN
jgi:hypothetical protein